MPTFALISEGVTDQIVLEKIIRLVYKGTQGADELAVTHLQPTRDATDQARQADEDFGGWQQVLEHCSTPENLYEAISLNDYVVIHIDSDICRHDSITIDPNLPFENLISAIESVVLDCIDPLILEAHREKFILAVAVHSTECWLLPFFTSVAAERIKVNSCEDMLRVIARRDRFAYTKDGPGYLDLVRNIKKIKDVTAAAACSPSLKRFIEALPGPI